MHASPVFTLAVLVSAAPALSQVMIPAEFESPSQTLSRLFTIGGVSSFTLSSSGETVYEGGSLRLDIAFNDNGIFSFSNVGLGALGVDGVDFLVDPGADTFSIGVKTPSPAVGGLRLLVTLRDDDNADGVIDLNDDDEWLAGPVTLDPGVGVYNIPLADFTDANPGDGDDTPNFGQGLAGTMILTIETAESMPGGMVTQPVTLFIDHAGAYVGAQSIPDAGCPADLAEPSGVLDFSDVVAFLTAFGTADPAADFAPPVGVFDFSDVLAFLSAFASGCP
ncbi:MAG: GC-type dockerin domain-anchored protein [Phycisphaerales bacterium]